MTDRFLYIGRDDDLDDADNIVLAEDDLPPGLQDFIFAEPGMQIKKEDVKAIQIADMTSQLEAQARLSSFVYRLPPLSPTYGTEAGWRGGSDFSLFVQILRISGAGGSQPAGRCMLAAPSGLPWLVARVDILWFLATSGSPDELR